MIIDGTIGETPNALASFDAQLTELSGLQYSTFEQALYARGSAPGSHSPLLLLLTKLILQTESPRVLELGSGMSTFFLANAVAKANGTFVSIEDAGHWYCINREIMKEAKIPHEHYLHVPDLKAQIEQFGPFDVVFVDNGCADIRERVMLTDYYAHMFTEDAVILFDDCEQEAYVKDVCEWARNRHQSLKLFMSWSRGIGISDPCGRLDSFVVYASILEPKPRLIELQSEFGSGIDWPTVINAQEPDTKPLFNWDHIQRTNDGKILLCYRHERIFSESFMSNVVDVLDVGGWGVLARRFLEEGKNCLILDLFTKDQLYPDRVRALPHKIGDVRDSSNFNDGSFDLITCFEMLEHCGDALLAMKNMYKWLRNGAWIVGTVPIDGFCHYEGEPMIQLLSENALSSALKDAGFENVFVEKTKSIGLEDENPCSIYFRAQKSN